MTPASREQFCLLIVCCIHCSSDSQCFTGDWTTQKMPPSPWGIWNPVLGPCESPNQMASWSVHFHMAYKRDQQTDTNRPCYSVWAIGHIWQFLWCGLKCSYEPDHASSLVCSKYALCFKKVSCCTFCYNFVNCYPILLKFGTNVAEAICSLSESALYLEMLWNDVIAYVIVCKQTKWVSQTTISLL